MAVTVPQLIACVYHILSYSGFYRRHHKFDRTGWEFGEGKEEIWKQDIEVIRAYPVCVSS